MKKHLMLARIFTLVLLVLEAMPTAAVMYFMTDDGRIKQTVSYFDPLTYGYADFGPFLAACLTVLLAMLLTVMLFRETRMLCKISAGVSIAAALTSLLPVLFGFEWMSAISWCISVVLVCESVLLCIYAKHSGK